jgi:hypothetical protein
MHRRHPASGFAPLCRKGVLEAVDQELLDGVQSRSSRLHVDQRDRSRRLREAWTWDELDPRCQRAFPRHSISRRDSGLFRAGRNRVGTALCRGRTSPHGRRSRHQATPLGGCRYP